MSTRFKIAHYIAIGATAATIIGFIIDQMATSSIGMNIMVMGALAGIVSYCFAGLFTALKIAYEIGKVGWLFVAFPYCILTFIFTFLVAVFALFFVPIIPVRKACKQYG